MTCELEHKIFTITDTDFPAAALAIFQFQARHNPVYRDFIQALAIDPLSVTNVAAIPFLPIGFFKTHIVSTTEFSPQKIFQSSGTTQSINSRHFVKDLSIYEESFLSGFKQFYGDPSEWCIIGLLPSYLERNNSSLVHMVNELITQSGDETSGFYLNEFEKLAGVLQQLNTSGKKTLLIGVTFALLDFAEAYPQTLEGIVVMETGGMKGRKEEMVRQEVHEHLKTAWMLDTIHSEYGMTELLSQAYSQGDGIFDTPPWMKVLLREDDDPLSIKLRGRGLINVIDLANIYSCSFIATDDVGKLYDDGKFEVLGRRDNSDLRGCSLMAASI